MPLVSRTSYLWNTRETLYPKVECKFNPFIALQTFGFPPGRPLLLATATGPAHNAPNIAGQPQGLAKRNAIKLTDFGIGGASPVNSMKQMAFPGILEVVS